MTSSRIRRVVIMQPYFLPYRNYYGLIRRCDDFVVFDDVQFCRRWQQRNCIPDGRGGKIWLTVPVTSRRPHLQRICDVELVSDASWVRRMLRIVERVYGNHAWFDRVFPSLRDLLGTQRGKLADLTFELLRWSASAMGLAQPVWRWSSEIPTPNSDRNQRLIDICRQLGATHYICGSAARVYLRSDLFAKAGIEVVWHEEEYQPYPQAATPAFEHFVSALDLLMNHGGASHAYLVPINAP
jgi:hypothetical protein